MEEEHVQRLMSGKATSATSHNSRQLHALLEVGSDQKRDRIAAKSKRKKTRENWMDEADKKLRKLFTDACQWETSVPGESITENLENVVERTHDIKWILCKGGRRTGGGCICTTIS